MMLNVCFVGVGSIAKRHIRNLKEVCKERQIELHIDAIRRINRLENDDNNLGLEEVFSHFSEVKKVYDVIFITNPTEMHVKAINEAIQYGKNFFIEKPISSVHQLPLVEQLKTKEESIYYVACPLRYNAVIQYIKKNIDLEDIISVRSISSSYLPDWRLGTDYRDTYSAHKELGGGVSIDLIHEWDYLTFLFGDPSKVYSLMGKKSKLDLDSEDLAIYIAEYPDKMVELHLDYFGRRTIREIMLFTKDDTILGDIANNRIHFLKNDKVIDFQEGRDDYQRRELNHFFDMIMGTVQNDSDVEHAVKVLKLTQGSI